MSATSTTLTDPVQMEIFSHRLLSITEEMGVQLVRSSFSPNIKERRDCSVALFDARGRVVAQAAHIPIHLGSLLGGVEAVLRDHALADMAPGDAFVLNDAYLAGGTHLPDIAIVTPVFHRGSPRFLVANLGHHADVGGSVPGSISHASGSIFEEGIRIPPTRLARAGEVDEGLLRLLAHNTREPEERILDLRVQVATNEAGARRVQALVERLGLDATERAIDDLLRYTRRRLANRIRALADGEHHYTTWMDHDGMGGEPLPIRAAARVAFDRLHLDFTGTGGQSRGSYNVMPSGVLATVAYALKALLDPELPPNSGLFDAIELTVPEGTILNPRFPAAVGARTTTCQKLSGAVFGALQGLLPEASAMASSHDVLAAMVFSGERRSSPDHPGRSSASDNPTPGADGSGASPRTYVYLETVGGGGGARGDGDGLDGAHVHITNSLNMPAEAVETEYPLRVEEYSLIPDSGGAGAHRGGLGIAREVRALDGGTVFSGRGDGFVTRADGARGGLPGSHCRLVLNPRTTREVILEPKLSNQRLAAGDTVRMETPGAGGLGDPAKRDPAALARDLADGKVSRESAERDYGSELVEAALASPTER